MSETNRAPKLHLRCSSTIPFHRWTKGKLYPVTHNDTVWDDDGGLYSALVLARELKDEFKLVWLLPDGTELEALE